MLGDICQATRASRSIRTTNRHYDKRVSPLRGYVRRARCTVCTGGPVSRRLLSFLSSRIESANEGSFFNNRSSLSTSEYRRDDDS